MVWGVFDWADGGPAKSEEESEADYPECDYDTNLTPLYEAIEERAWIAVNQFLHSGYWPESLFADPMSPEDQARTWVTRYETRPDGSKKVRWSQLPIHAAVIFGAPSVVIQQLVEAFPQSVRCTDDHRMLPLHLAFRHGSDDSVLALFLEEFPEAVNVRGYKGRLPVECAQKGPNPERGAIIQTILHKNQSVWERKKSAVQLKELYCIKEALKIKSQKVSHLETAIREIKSREHKTRKELGATMTELKAAKIKTKVDDETLTATDKSAERQAVKQLVEKLAALEMATKDLVDKEKATKKELKKTIAELEATKKMKPSDDQVEQFAQLYKVASVEEANKLDRNDLAAQQASLKRTSSRASFHGDAKQEALAKSTGAPQSILKKAEDTTKEAVSEKKTEKSNPVKSTPKAEDTEAAKKAEEAALMKRLEEAAVKKAEQVATKKLEEAVVNKKVASKKEERAAAKKKAKEAAKKKAEEAAKKKAEQAAAKKKAKEAAKEAAKKKAEEKKKAETKKAEEEAAKKVAEEEAEEAAKKQAEEAAIKRAEEAAITKKAEEAALKKAEATIKSAEEAAIKRAEKAAMEKAEAAIKRVEEAAMKKAEAAVKKAAEATAKKAEQNASRALASSPPAKVPQIPRSASRELEKEKIRKMEEANDALEKKIADLACTMKAYEEKSSKKQEELEAVSIPDQYNNFSEQQTEQMTALQAEMKSLKENSDRTKGELETALRKLEQLRVQQQEGASAALVEKTRMHKESQETNKKLEKKVALLELALQQFDDKSSLAKTEMNNIKETIMTDTDVKLTAAQERYMARLEDSMKKLEKNAMKTKKELDSALTELDTMKATERESAQLLAAAEQDKLKSVEQTNRALEEKIATLEATMKQFEDKASKTKEEMDQAMDDLKKSDESTVASGASLKLTKKQKQHMAALEHAMKKLEDRANSTKDQLDKALEELTDLKKTEEVAYVKNEALSKRESKAMKDLAKKVQALQTAMVGFEVKETKTMQELEKAMLELEDASTKRFEVLSKAAEKTEELATDGALTKEVTRLDKRAEKEEKRLAELEAAVQEVITKGGNTKEELERTQQLLQEVQTKNEEREPPITKEEKEEAKQDKKLIKELSKKVTTLQSAVVGFEVKETRTMKELEHTMKQLEELTSKRFEVLEQAAAMKDKDTEKLAAAGALAEEKVAALHTAMRELEQNSAQTHEELEKTKLDLETMRAANVSGEGVNKKIIASQEGQIKELNEKITILQQAVMGFEVKETKTMQELEHTMKQLEELTAKRFEVLQKVAGREIEAAKAAEANKYTQKAAQEEKKVAALEFAMRELESKAYKTKLELERTMKGLEHLEEKQEVSQQEVTGVTKDEKRVMRELVSKVADIQEAVMAYDEKENKTTQELERTKQELEATKKEVEDLRATQAAVVEERHVEEVKIISTDDAQSEVEAVEVNDAVESEESKEASETAKRMTEETLSSLEVAIHRLVERLGNEEEQENASAMAEKIAAELNDSKAEPSKEEESPSATSKDIEEGEKLAPTTSSASSKEEESPSATSKDIEEGETTSSAFQAVFEKLAPTSSDTSEKVEPTADVSEKLAPTASYVSKAPVIASAPAAPTLATSKPPEKRRSFFGRLSSGRLSSAAKPNSSRKLGKKKSKGGSRFFGSKKSSGKTTQQQVVENTIVASAPPTPPAPLVTPEQRKAVEAIHGAEICALLTDEQIQGLLSKMKETPALKEQPSIEIVASALSSSAEKSATNNSVDAQSAMSQSAANSTGKTDSVHSSGMKEEDPHMMIVSLPSQRGIPANASMKSTKSQKSQKSVLTVPTSPRNNKIGSISPAPLPPTIDAVTDKPKDVLVADGTYDDGFEINF